MGWVWESSGGDLESEYYIIRNGFSFFRLIER